MPDLPGDDQPVDHHVWPLSEGQPLVRAFVLAGSIAPGARNDHDRRPLTLYRCVLCQSLVDTVGMGGHWSWHHPQG